MQRNPDTVRGPDIVLFLESRKFEELSLKYPDRMPALIVEVLSPNDRFHTTVKRIQRFLEKGAAMAWLMDPEDQIVYVFVPNQFPLVVEGDEEVTGGNVLPDFHCKASEFFFTPE